MANAYKSPYADIDATYNAKVAWTNATTDEERKKQEAIANAARERLKANGYEDVANQISATGADVTATKAIRDKWAKMGKTATRDYLYTLGQSKGMSQSDIDKLISWDNDTGEVSFGGKKIGTPDSVVDGVSYWGDTSVLDSAFNDYISRSGYTQSDERLQEQHNNEIQSKINQNWGTIQSDRDKYYSEYDKVSDYVNSDVTKTDEYKSAFDNIMPQYNLKAMQGRDNAVASGGASNGGNIDSYAAANALRQQTAITAQGQALAHQIGLETYNARVNNAKSILSDLGVYQQNSWDAMGNLIDKQSVESQRLFENGETAKNNEAARQEVYSGISGTVGDKVTKYLNSNIWNEDGSLVNPNQDFWAQMVAVRNLYDSTTDENERARLWEQLRLLEAQRNQKIDEQGLSYGKTYGYQGNPKTADMQKAEIEADIAESEIKATKEINADNNATTLAVANAGNASNEKINADNNATTLTVANLQANATKMTGSQATTALKNGELSESILKAYNDANETSYTMDNPPPVYKKPKSVKDSGSGNNSNEPAIYKTWETNNITFKPIKVTTFDQSKATSSDVDEYGKKAINSVISAVANGQLATSDDGSVSNYDLVDYLVYMSDDNDTDAKQLKKVFSYFGLSPLFADYIEDVGKGRNLKGIRDFTAGVKYNSQ